MSHPHLEERLLLCQPSADTPDWWQPGKHDKELLLGAAKHGLGRTDITILNDPDFSFHKVLSKHMYSNIQSKLADKPEKAIKIENREDILKFDKDEILVKLEKGEGTLKIEKVGAKKDKDLNVTDKKAENIDSEKSQVELTIIKAENKVEELPISNALTITTIPRSTPVDKEPVTKIKTEEKSEVIIESVKPEVSKTDPVTGNDTKTDEMKVNNAAENVDESATVEVEKESQSNEKDPSVEVEKESQDEKLEESQTPDTSKETIEKGLVEQKSNTETTEKTAESNEVTAVEESKSNVKTDLPVIKEEAETQEAKPVVDASKDKGKVCKLEDKCSVQAAELKAMFPDLEVIQPLSRLTQIDTFVLRDKPIDYNEPTIVQLLSHNSNSSAKWPKVNGI